MRDKREYSTNIDMMFQAAKTMAEVNFENAVIIYPTVMGETILQARSKDRVIAFKSEIINLKIVFILFSWFSGIYNNTFNIYDSLPTKIITFSPI